MGAFHPLNWLYALALWVVIICAGYYVAPLVYGG
jgi:hypothetical protein